MAGRFLDQATTHAMAIRNAGAIGECQFGTRILNLDFEAFHGDMTSE